MTMKGRADVFANGGEVPGRCGWLSRLRLLGRRATPFRDRRIGVRLLAAILCTSTALAIVASAVQLYADYRRDLSAIDQEFLQIERSSLETLANSLWSFNDTQIQLQLDGLTQLPDILYVDVIGSPGERFSSGRKPTGNAITREFVLRYSGQDQTELGRLRVSADLGAIYSRLLDTAIVILLTQTAKTFLISLLILMLVSRWVTRPLETLARYARGLSLDRLDERATLSHKPGGTPDELDDVAAALNQMADALAAELRQRGVVEAELRRSEERFRDYAETASDWFWETGTDHRLTYLSNHQAALSGDPGRRLGKTRWDLATDVATEPEKWQAHLAALERRVTFRDFIYQTRDEGPAERFVATSGKPKLGADGEFLGYRGTGRDITEAMRSERALREAKERAEIASGAKSEFLANMSHELRTPLNAIIGFAELMALVPFTSERADRYQSYARDIHTSGRHLLDIINGLLNVAQIEARKFELDERTLRLEEVVAEVVKMMTPQMEQAGLTLVCEIEPKMPGVRADARAMRQILLNLVSNALKFTPKGGTTTIRLARAAMGGVRLSVTDTGIGIAAEDIGKLMQPFTQLDNVYHRKHPGTGLGLSLVRSLAELHGGAAEIESLPGRGTTVTVWLPETRLVAI
jgi:PAS domain S-box-containing protein